MNTKKVYVLIHDRDKKNNPFVETYYQEDKELFAQKNKEGYGVYVTINDFSATEEQMKVLGVKTARNIAFLTKINAVFADLDIAKRGDGKSRDEKEKLKETLIFALYEVLPPTMIIDTSNGLQPLWCLKESSTDENYQHRYVNVINRIIEWSKKHGAMGDAVKDVTRVLRLPGYNHMKEEPYMVTVKYRDNFIYSLEDLERVFGVEETPTFQNKQKIDVSKLDDISRGIEMIDFRDLIVHAFASIGRSVEFDKSGHMIDPQGGTTGTFIGRKGNRDYLASSSHEPYKGNRITAVADIKGINNKDARKWIIEEFNLKNKIIEKPKVIKAMKNYYSWGTKVLTETFAPIKRDTYGIIGAGTGTGKTTFCLNMALENCKLGHNVLYISLEMDTTQIFDQLGRNAAGITVKEEVYNQIPDWKTKIYKKRIEELKNIKNFTLKGVQGGTGITWDCLKSMMNGDWDLIFVDNFNLIEKDDRMTAFEHEGLLSKRFLSYVAENQTPVLVVHHYSKGGAREGVKSGYSLSGNTKIANDSLRTVLLERERPTADQEQTPKEKAAMKVLLDKARGGYDNGITRIIYFQKGIFTDSFDE